MVFTIHFECYLPYAKDLTIREWTYGSYSDCLFVMTIYVVCSFSAIHMLASYYKACKKWLFKCFLLQFLASSHSFVSENDAVFSTHFLLLLLDFDFWHNSCFLTFSFPTISLQWWGWGTIVISPPDLFFWCVLQHDCLKPARMMFRSSSELPLELCLFSCKYVVFAPSVIGWSKLFYPLCEWTSCWFSCFFGSYSTTCTAPFWYPFTLDFDQASREDFGPMISIIEYGFFRFCLCEHFPIKLQTKQTIWCKSY